jgi:hypothetical protein
MWFSFTRSLGLACSRIAVFGLCVLLPAGMVYGVMLVATRNFNTVIPGELYRSAQPDAASLKRYKELHGIKTVH